MRTTLAAAEPDPTPDVIWTVSSFCESNACVEVAFVFTEGVVLVRSNGYPTPMQLSLAEWSAFVAGVKNGEFDGPDMGHR